MSKHTLYLERPAFWTEVRDPDCWRRALKALAGLEDERGAIPGTPRSVWQRYLKSVLSRRSVLGLFGMVPGTERHFLLGAGLLAYHTDQQGWKLTPIAKPLVADGLSEHEAMERLAAALLRQSPWLRLLVFRLRQGDWALAGRRRLRDGRGTLRSSLIFHRHAEFGEWFAGIEGSCANEWLAPNQAVPAIRLHPEVLKRDARRDNFSWAPFEAPLYLFDALGWMTDDGELRMPQRVVQAANLVVDPRKPPSASAVLRDITEREADLRGFVPVERVLRELHDKIQPEPAGGPMDFAGWMDALMTCALDKGAIEVLATEPGQARHGRGLFGDRQQKLVKWVVHEDLDECLAEDGR